MSLPSKTNTQKIKSILWTSWYLGKDVGSKGLDVADKGLNTLTKWIANVHDQANTPTPTNPEIPQAMVEMAERYQNLSEQSQKLVDDVMKDTQLRISQIMENDARQFTNDKSDSV